MNPEQAAFLLGIEVGLTAMLLGIGIGIIVERRSHRSLYAMLDAYQAFAVQIGDLIRQKKGGLS